MIRKMSLLCAAALLLGGCGAAESKNTAPAAEVVSSAPESYPEDDGAFELKTDAAPIADGDPKSGEYGDYVELASYKDIPVLAPEDAAVENGMTVEIDYAGHIGVNYFDGGSGSGYFLQVGTDLLIKGFDEQLLGHKAGDRFSVKLTLPDTYPEQSVAGQKAVFDVTINKVYLTLPYLALTQIVDGSTVRQYPKSMYEKWEQVYTELYCTDPSGKKVTLEAALKEAGMTTDSFRSQVEGSTKNELVYRAILDSEGIPTDGEVFSEAQQEAARSFGFDNAEEMLTSGSSQADLDIAALERLCISVLEGASPGHSS